MSTTTELKPEFDSLGIARNWQVTVEVDAERVLCISNQHCAGKSELEQYEATIENCAKHLLAFIGRSAAHGEPSKAGEWTDEHIHELWQRSYLTALEQAGVCIGNVDVAHMNQPIVFARALLSSAPAQAAQSEDAKLLDWLEQHGHVRFTFENAEISFQIPDELEGANSIRELIKSSMDDVKDE